MPNHDETTQFLKTPPWPRPVSRSATAWSRGAGTGWTPAGVAPLVVDPAPLFELSPYLYMQFMEPLGATDGSVEAAWDHMSDRWRDDVVAVTRELAPTMMRWGGIFADFYRWREGVGPRDSVRRCSTCSGAAGVQPGRHRRIRGLLPAGWRRAADLRQL